jgi:hypothetical protein
MSTTEDRLNTKLKLWNMRQDDFAVIASLLGALPGISRSRAQRALAGKGLGFGAEAALALDALVRDVDAIISAARPLPLSLNNVALVVQLVTSWREKRLTIDVKLDNQ